MRKLLILIFLTLICRAVNAQEFNIVGKWEVKEVISPKTVENENMQNMMNGLSESTFHLNKDQTIKITSTNPTQGLRYFTMMADDAVWNFKDNTITLVDKKTKGLMMKIFVATKDDKTIFTFYESNLILEVVRKD